MMIRRKKFAFIAAMTVLSLSGTATAADLGYCDPAEDPNECQCSEKLISTDSCATIDEEKLINPADVQTYREAINLTPSWDEETDELHIASDFTNFNAGGILPLHENRGHWESAEELQGYVNALVGKSYVDQYCETGTLPHPMMSLNGTVARWDQDENVWAAAQVPDPVWGAISDSLGRVWINGDVAAAIEMHFTGCDHESDGDFSGTQCSGVIEWTYEIERRVLCTEFDPGMQTRTARGMGTEQKDFFWKGENSERKAVKNDEGDVLGFINVLVRFDKSELSNIYYDSGGNAVNMSNPHKNPIGRKSDYNRITSGEAGVCGDGIADKNNSHLDFMSTAGTAAGVGSCPHSL